MNIILDWNKPNTIRMKKYIQVRTVAGGEEIHYHNSPKIPVEFITFRNFPQLHIESNQMLDCTFENCGNIYLSNDKYGHSRCTFRNIKALFCSCKFLTHCIFTEIECLSIALIELSNCYLGACSFENIRLLGDTYLVHSSEPAWGYSFKLRNIASGLGDKQLFKNVDVR